MTQLGLYVHALRVARPRQLRARVERPVRRRVLPRVGHGTRLHPLDVELWRSRAFATADEVAGEASVQLLGKEFPYPPPDWSLPGEPRLRRFHIHYGDEILGWARRGDLAAASAGLEAWIAANPPRRGDAWHPYPLSTRVGNWIAAASLAPELATPDVAESLRRQLAYLARNVEDEILGNHVIRNARALALGGAALGDDRLLEHGISLLRRELPEQVLPDGGHYERSPAYHLLVLRDLLEVDACAAAPFLGETISRMRRFGAALSRPDGRPALFNDGAFDLAPELDLPLPDDGLTAFPDTGYVVVRERDVWLAFDCGPPAPSFLPPHAHADALSFQLWAGGRPVVVDPGTYTYEPGHERDLFRSTRSHSTVMVDGRDQFQLWGAFRAGPFPPTRLVSTTPLTAEVRLGGIVHRRTLRLERRALHVEDELEGSGRATVRSTLPLGIGSASVEYKGGLPTLTEPAWLSERMLLREPIQALVATGDVGLPARFGWVIGLPSSE